jgi:hypothetical protein
VGHLFQGRFKAILVDQDAYLLEVCRYVELNPVRASMVQHPGDWPWSSYLAHTGQVDSPVWLDTAGLHGYLLGHDVKDKADRQRAIERYVALVAAGQGVALWADSLRQQIYLGDEDFVTRMQALVNPAQSDAVEVPRTTPANQTHLGPVVRNWPRPRASAAQRLQALRHQHDIHGTRAGLVAFSGEPIDWQTRNLRCEKCAIANGRRGIRMRCIITSKLNQEHTAGNCYDRPRT